jgi:YVTN family beta-propeller protein
MKSRFQALWLVVCAGALLLLAMGCNDTLRQFITPIPPPTGDPGALAHAITLSTNPAPTGDGSDMHVDVSGDSSVGIVPLGANPVFLGKSGNKIFAVDSGDATNPPTVTTYIALLPQTTTISTVTLPTSAIQPVAGGTSSSNNIYIANRGSNDVSVISGTILAVIIDSIPVGAQPVMVAGNASNNQIFVINNGDDSVTQISTIDNTVVRTIHLAAGSKPIWGVMSTDGLFVFVVDQGTNKVSVIDTSTGGLLPDITVGTSPNFAFYEPTLRRVYVSNTGSQNISVINANGISDTNPPTLLKNVLVSGTPTSVTALTSGTKAYAALGNCGAGVNHLTLLDSTATTNNLATCTGNLVSVIDTVGLNQIKTIPVGSGTVSIDASGDASRVYVISALDITTIRDNVHAPNCTGTSCLPGPPLPDRTFTTPSISVIRTATDSVVITPVDPSVVNSPLPTFHVPQQSPNCTPTIDNNFNKIVPMPCALQTPFMVRTFP